MIDKKKKNETSYAGGEKSGMAIEHPEFKNAQKLKPGEKT